MEDDDGTGGDLSAVDEGDSLFEETRSKRKRVGGVISPTNVDVSQLLRNIYSENRISQNRFSLLADVEIENVGHVKNTKCNNSTKENGGSVPKGPASNNFCPPIFLYDVNIKSLSEQLEAKSPKLFFKIKNVNRRKAKLYLTDVAVHTEMMELLKDKKITSYSFTPKEFKQTSLVLRGLYYGTEVDNIKAALDNIVPETVSKVTKFTTSYSKKNNLDTGLFLVSLLTGKKLTDIANIKYLLHQTISWEKPKKKEQEIQCHRCQLWGHISKNCNSVFKCVKCKDLHNPGECPRNKDSDSEPSCVNCNEAGHPANWKGCPTYKKYLSSKIDRINKIRDVQNTAKNNVKRLLGSSLISPDKSFANLLKPQVRVTENQWKRKSPVIEKFLELANYFLEPEEQSLDREVNNFLNNYKTMPKSESKDEFLRILNKIKNVYGP